MLARGIIFLWYGSIASIPTGFAFCDGNNGTPDLRNKFVPGAGDSFNPGDEGGINFHSHSFTSDGHDHTMISGQALEEGTVYSYTLSSEVDTGTTGPKNHLPPYHALAYIMKT